MIRTEDIAEALELTAKLLELHEGNDFKIKSLKAAAFKLTKTRITIEQISIEQLTQIEGVGKSLAEKIIEFTQTNTLKELEELKQKTPEGVIEMLTVKGLGPKKVKTLWRDLSIDSITDLLYACNENKLITLNGFGAKTQQSIIDNIEFKIQNSGKYHYAFAEKNTKLIIDALSKECDLVSYTGAMHRKCEIIDEVDILIGNETIDTDDIESDKLAINFIKVNPLLFYKTLVETSSTKEHLDAIKFDLLISKPFKSETEVYEALQIPYCEAELREGNFELQFIKNNQPLPKLLEPHNLKGILHNHTTYSDGLNTLQEMAVACKKLGFEYLGICDHSQTAVYAGGLTIEQISKQHQEINHLNETLKPFKILKGIESDILPNGQLDYPDEILKTFDFIVGSIHSAFSMTEDKATERLITAIENPYLDILGHPTGRLLLGRKGYPINHKKVIDACAANNVIIELNAHPYRLDIDWRWIPYCLEKNVMISINPDAHHINGYNDMLYGTHVARKGLLTQEMCFNAKPLAEVEQQFKLKKIKTI